MEETLKLDRTVLEQNRPGGEECKASGHPIKPGTTTRGWVVGNADKETQICQEGWPGGEKETIF